MGLFKTLFTSSIVAILSTTPMLANAQSVDSETMTRIKHELTSGIPIGGVLALQQLRDARNVASDIPLTAATRPQPTQQPLPAATIEHL